MVLLVTSTVIVSAQSYKTLWANEQEAEVNDLPQTQREVLAQIVRKAEREGQYGHLLKALLKDGQVAVAVSPDSLKPFVERLKQRQQKTATIPLQAIYQAVLGRLYSDSPILDDRSAEIGLAYRQQAMRHAQELAAVPAADYQPLLVKGADSHYYGDNLLSAIAYETRQFRQLHAYYLTTNNRVAQLFSGIEWLCAEENNRYGSKESVVRFDSLMIHYSDLKECGEAAIARFEMMRRLNDITPKEKIEYIDEALQRWGSWKRMDELRNERAQLTMPNVFLHMPTTIVLPGEDQKALMIDLRNLQSITLNVYRVNASGDINLNPEHERDYKQLQHMLKSKPEATVTKTFSSHKDYEMFYDSLLVKGLPAGVYMLEFLTNPSTRPIRSLYYVSNVRLLRQALPQNRLRYVVVDATTGRPLKDATLRLKIKKNTQAGKTEIVTMTTDDEGECLYSLGKDRLEEAFAYTATDRYCPTISGNGYYRIYKNNRDQQQVALYTDRAIYRPGQKVQVAAILYAVRNGFEHEVVAGKKVKVALCDASYKEVASCELTSDEYGRVNTEFLLPAQGLTGRYSVVVNNNSCHIQVETYKRPTFEVEFPKVTQAYQAGDTLRLSATAKTFAGVPVQGGRVKYTVERRVAFWWLDYYRYWETAEVYSAPSVERLVSDETTTDDDGHFTVTLPLVMPEGRHPQFYQYVVKADVTDVAGETRQGVLSLPLGNKSTALTIDLEEKVLLERAQPFTLRLLNAAGHNISAVVRYQIDGGRWKETATDTPVTLPTLKSGRHQLLAVCGKDSVERSFVVFSLSDRRAPVDTEKWFYLSDTQFPDATTPVTLQIGSSAPDTHIVYTILAGDSIIEQGAVDKSGEIINRKFTYKEAYGNGLTLDYVWVRDGKMHTQSAEIRRPLPNKQLTLKWETFRDRLTPGQHEEWTLSIASPSGAQVAGAALLATLYDKSLDQLTNHNWQLQPFVWLPLTSAPWSMAYRGNILDTATKYPKFKEVNPLSFWHFDEGLFPTIRFNRNPPMRFRGTVLQEVALAKSADVDELASSNVPIGSYDVKAKEIEEEVVVTGYAAPARKNNAEPVAPQLRQNMQETAFFFPRLLSDSEGRVMLKFTLPESLTTWRFMGLAHTKDMMYGLLEGETVARKDVMIQPNMPRFVRQGDEAVLAARVANTTDEVIEGIVRLELKDAETDRVLLTKQVACTLEAGTTASVSIPVEADALKDQSLLVCKMTVQGSDFSDGEQHYLPVLPNRERVTVTVPFVQTEPGTATIDLPAVPQHEQGKITVEYTNNPAWLMIHALPTVAHAHDHCAICQATALYTNALGRYIVSKHPKVKDFAATSGSTLYSKLEQNEELKDLLLSETPWVMDADRERDQQQRLADFFDATLMEDRLSSAIDHLNQLQNVNGSWSWWEGMEGSYFMTVEVSQMLARLQYTTGKATAVNATGYDKIVDRMLNKAISYMDAEVVKLVKEMKQAEKKGVKATFPSHKTLQYLYIYSLKGRKATGEVAAAHTYLKSLLKKEGRNLTIYDKALASVVLNSGQFLKSLHEWSTYKEGVGRYYDTPRATSSWRDYRIPTQVAVIEAMKRLAPSDQKTIRQLQQWLLHEKRAQAWDTPLNSVEAIYAFFDGQTELLDAQPQTVLKVDGRELKSRRSDNTSAAPYTGYVKRSLPVAADAPSPKTLTAEKTSAGTSWGAVYAQYMQDVKAIDAQGSELSVTRQLLIEKDGRYVPVEGREATLAVGSRIRVRLTIDAQRDMDFVELIDRRAACLEPFNQLSGYRNGAYVAPNDNATHYFFDRMPKGRRVIETEYYVDRAGRYETGTCTVQCAYAPEMRATTHSLTLVVKAE